MRDVDSDWFLEGGRGEWERGRGEEDLTDHKGAGGGRKVKRQLISISSTSNDEAYIYDRIKDDQQQEQSHNKNKNKEKNNKTK